MLEKLDLKVELQGLWFRRAHGEDPDDTALAKADDLGLLSFI